MKSSDPILLRETPSKRQGSQVLRVTIFRRRGSRFWQARVWSKGKLVRITTKTQSRAAAEEFALLAWRHFSRGGGAHNPHLFRRSLRRANNWNLTSYLS